MEMIRKISDYLLDIILPKKCIGCNRTGSFLCEDCYSLVEINPYRYCLCDKPRILSGNIKCKLCQKKYLDSIYSATSHNDFIEKKIINEMKEHFQLKSLCLPISALILTHLQEVGFEFKQGMLIIPVPMYKNEERQRGFNQAKEITKIISSSLGIDSSIDNLIRIKKMLNRNESDNKERLLSFILKKPEEIRGKDIILIDDLYNTGETMEECAKKLKEAGATLVHGVTFIREIVRG